MPESCHCLVPVVAPRRRYQPPMDGAAGPVGISGHASSSPDEVTGAPCGGSRERGDVELRVVREHGQHGALVEAPRLRLSREVAVRPLDDDLVGGTVPGPAPVRARSDPVSDVAAGSRAGHPFVGAVAEELALPDRQPVLHLVHQEGGSREGLLPVSGRDGHDQRDVPDPQLAQPV